MAQRNFKQYWLQTIRHAHNRGVPIPLVRDNKTGYGSVSLTLTIVAFNMWMLSVIGKVAGVLGGMDPGQCLNMFIACGSLYFGRKFQKDGDKTEMSGPEKAEEKAKE
jgi:hypothetical protein